MRKVYIAPEVTLQKLNISSYDEITNEISIGDYPAFDDGTLPVTPPF